MFDFVMKMFSEGDAALPALGMEEIPKTSESITCQFFLYNTKVVDIHENTIFTNSGAVKSDIIIVATGNDLISKLK
jgi:hypothetical protein